MILGKYKVIACNVFVYLAKSLGSSRTQKNSSRIQKMVFSLKSNCIQHFCQLWGPSFLLVFLCLVRLFRISFSLSKPHWSLTDPVQKAMKVLIPAHKNLVGDQILFHSDWKIIDDRNCSDVKIARTPMSESLRDWDEKSVEVLARGWFWCNWDVGDSLFSSNTHSSRSSPTNWASNKTVVTFSHRRILVQIWTPIQTWLGPCKKVMLQTRVLPPLPCI